MTSEFRVIKKNRLGDARIFAAGGQQVAEIRKTEGTAFRMSNRDDSKEWEIDNLIDGEHRRFSFSVRATTDNDGEVLRIRDNVFMHNGNFYMLANHPQGRPWQDHVNSQVRYISRLTNFPYSGLSEMAKDSHHHAMQQKLKRFRGTPVGEASGLAVEPGGHTVKVNDELDDIALFLAAASYLMYAQA